MKFLIPFFASVEDIVNLKAAPGRRYCQPLPWLPLPGTKSPAGRGSAFAGILLFVAKPAPFFVKVGPKLIMRSHCTAKGRSTPAGTSGHTNQQLNV